MQQIHYIISNGGYSKIGVTPIINTVSPLYPDFFIGV